MCGNAIHFAYFVVFFLTFRRDINTFFGYPVLNS